MAKKLVSWGLTESVLTMSRYIDRKQFPDEPIVIEAEFDLMELMLVIEENPAFQIQSLAYLAKQKLSDTGASSVGDTDGKVAGAKKRWAELLAGKWAGERVNATGAKEERELAKSVKEVAKVISLEGLVMKKAMSGLPNQPIFTEEDQAKLDEFMTVAVEALKGKN